MNKFAKGLFLAAVVLLLLSSCILEPNSELQLEFKVTNISYTSPSCTITYYVDNQGDFDIPDLRLYFEVDLEHSGSNDAEGWSSEFYIGAGESKTRNITFNSIIGKTLDLATYDYNQLVLITAIGMDNPPDE